MTLRRTSGQDQQTGEHQYWDQTLSCNHHANNLKCNVEVKWTSCVWIEQHVVFMQTAIGFFRFNLLRWHLQLIKYIYKIRFVYLSTHTTQSNLRVQLGLFRIGIHMNLNEKYLYSLHMLTYINLVTQLVNKFHGIRGFCYSFNVYSTI